MIDPIRYLVNSRNGAKESMKVVTIASVLSVANNQSVISAVTGKIIRVMGFKIIGGSAGSTVALQSASGGTPFYTTALSANAQDVNPIVETGYFETVVGEGLFADVVTSSATVSISYITYTP